MRLFIRRALSEPFWMMGALWPLALLAPFAPLLPKTNGLPWRQELVTAFLLAATLAVLARHIWKHATTLSLSSDEIALALPLLLFVIWSAASSLWAISLFPALHHTLVWSAYLLFFLLMRRAAGNARLLRLSIIGLGVVV